MTKPSQTGSGAGKSPRAAAPALETRGISKAYGGTQALDDVSFAVEGGTVHALLGGNGSGKSTMVKILAGVVDADAGELSVGGQGQDARSQTPARAREMGLHFVHQQDSTFPYLTVAENLSIGRGFESGFAGRIRWRDTENRTREVLERFGIDVDPKAELRTLGSATQMMIAIARALQDQEGSSRGVLVLDEPTASLPKAEVDLLLEALRRYAAAGQSILYVSHRLEEVLSVADRATVLRDGRLVENLDGRKLTHDNLVRAILGAELEALTPGGPKTNVGTTEALLEVRDGGGPVLELHPGEVVGVAGLLGSGRSRILRRIFGMAPRDGMVVTLSGRTVPADDPIAAMGRGIAYVPEDRVHEAAFLDLSVTHNLSMGTLREQSRAGWINSRQERRLARDAMERFGIIASSEQSLLSSLSGGNQQKTILARWLQRNPRVLLLDEPTQGVDVGARADIHALIREATESGASALIVSSDFEELAATCDRAIVVKEARVDAEIPAERLTEQNLNNTVYAREEVAA